MANKEQKRSSREAKKPKQKKKDAAFYVAFDASGAIFVATGTGLALSGYYKRTRP
jgi:hypothetical protein